MRKIEKNLENFLSVKEECQDYLEALDSDERLDNSFELDRCKDWTSLINSNIFKIAIGDVIVDNDRIVAVDED